MDFQKSIDDENNLVEFDDRLDQFFDYLVHVDKPITSQSNPGQDILKVPLLSYNKINKSPEYKSRAYLRASRLQRYLWKYYTSD